MRLRRGCRERECTGLEDMQLSMSFDQVTAVSEGCAGHKGQAGYCSCSCSPWQAQCYITHALLLTLHVTMQIASVYETVVWL